MLSKMQIIRPEEFPDDKVYILSKVKLKNLVSDYEIEYQLVGEEEADYELNKLSVTSLVGKALMKKEVGDIVEVNAPAGKIKYKILKIFK
jgi:transcription elongation factor GreA